MLVLIRSNALILLNSSTINNHFVFFYEKIAACTSFCWSFFQIVISMKLFAVTWNLMLALIICVTAEFNLNTFNILDYGAVGDGSTNDTLPFKAAWYDVCNTNLESTMMVIPNGKTYLLHPIYFIGPCMPKDINIQLEGTIIAHGDPREWNVFNQASWLVFQGVRGLSISGGGFINGNGKGWWDISCRYHPAKGCMRLAPTVLGFKQCSKVQMSDITIINSPQTHILVFNCSNVELSYLTIKAPSTSPNTDGIHIHASHDVSVYNSKIESGDDCISIGDHTSNIEITNINCGPGHGISIGSLGKGGGKVQVEKIYVSHVNFFNTTNGVRIKTWQVGTGHVREVIFEHLNFIEVQNPIIIDQHYCDTRYGCNETGNGVHISDVGYFKLFGTSNTQVAINLNCSVTFPCTRIWLDTIHLSPAVDGMEVLSSCNNAYGFASRNVEPNSCLVQLS